MPERTLSNYTLPLIRLALPLALIGLAQSGVFFFETLFLAHLGCQMLAAGALVSWLFGTIEAIIFGILTAVSVLVSHKFGAKNTVGISSVLRDGLFLALLFTLPAFLLFWNIAPIFLFFGQDSTVVTLSQSYLRALAWSLLPNFCSVVLIDFLVGLGKTRPIIVFTLIASPFTIFSSYLLIFGKLGLPALGIAGAGWGMTMSNWIEFILLAVFIFIKHRIYLTNFFDLNRSSFLSELLHVGLPMGFMYCVEVTFYFALTLLMGNIGYQTLAANQIILQYLGALITVIFAVAQAITIRIGHQLGTNQAADIEKTNLFGMGIAVFFMLIVAISYWFFPEKLISIDLDIRDPNNSNVITLAKHFFAIAAVFQIIEAARIALFGSLRGLRDTFFTLVVSIITFWGVALPIGYYAAIRLHYGGQGLWWAMVAAAIMGVIILIIRFQYKIKRITTRP
ncbi:MAG: MATE family efflux transporter [Gammaproteobacteria bacterium]|nr:MATE family efflux transporter [Gammaproteobacteria bacterium]